MNLAYHLQNVRFSYQSSPFLMMDSLQIRAGEFVALVGPNGSGKTTLLHLLAFLNIPQQGSVLFFEEPSTRKRLLKFRRRVGLLLQNPYLFKTTVLGNVITGLRLRGIRKKNAVSMAKEALSLVRLSGFEDRYVGSLSGGEAQRTALARTLVLDPDVLLLDEPSNHMDTESIRVTEQVVLELNKKKGKTIVLATHHISTLERHIDTVHVLDSGRITDSRIPIT
jgi:tungstate transport system ATP-binding protein